MLPQPLPRMLSQNVFLQRTKYMSYQQRWNLIGYRLHSLLPPVKSNPYGLRSRDRNFQLPVCKNFSRKSFIILVFLFK